MKVINEGHIYLLKNLGEGEQELKFIKRSGGAIKYDKEWPGLQTQEVLRSLIDRTKYLYKVMPCEETAQAIKHLRMTLYWYEVRAFRRKAEGVNRKENLHDDSDTKWLEYASDFPITEEGIEDMPIR